MKNKKEQGTSSVSEDVKSIEVVDHEVVSGPYKGEKDAAPLEMTKELEEQLVKEEKEKEKKQEKVKSSTVSYLNGHNEWQLIAKTHNDMLMWEHTTMAMQMPGGVLVHVKEAIAQKVNATTCFVPNAKLFYDKNSANDIKWLIIEKQER